MINSFFKWIGAGRFTDILSIAPYRRKDTTWVNGHTRKWGSNRNDSSFYNKKSKEIERLFK